MSELGRELGRISKELGSELGKLLYEAAKKPLKDSLNQYEDINQLQRLFKLQDDLIEHKFPLHGIFEVRLSDAGDIYREMAGGYFKRLKPYYPYIREKIDRLSAFASGRVTYLTEGDIEELKEQLKSPDYRALRDKYLKNLSYLREETVKTPMNSKRKEVMLASLDMIEALIRWYESLDRFNPPREELERLIRAVENYFPEESFM